MKRLIIHEYIYKCDHISSQIDQWVLTYNMFMPLTMQYPSMMMTAKNAIIHLRRRSKCQEQRKKNSSPWISSWISTQEKSWMLIVNRQDWQWQKPLNVFLISTSMTTFLPLKKTDHSYSYNYWFGGSNAPPFSFDFHAFRAVHIMDICTSGNISFPIFPEILPVLSHICVIIILTTQRI